jgi:alkanesulfonate monooxygenase SsuD/methylene tetrahydromethanopterin reductase-like flavin-dependent oxidoreductase (luciferase family)
MRVCLMIEGQEDVTWEDWRALAEACEGSGIEALFRSDHYLSVMGQTGRGSLDAWATISALAAVTSTLKLGTLVSPVTFRHPSVLAKSVVTADHVAGGGRIELGLGAGWLEAEHSAYGFPFPPTAERFEMLEEQIEIVRSEWTEDELDFAGRHYELRGLNALPKPKGQVNLIVGGRAKPRSLALAARWADEYNLAMMSPDEARAAMPRIRAAWEDAGRDPPVVSLMTGTIIGADEEDLVRRAAEVARVQGGDGDGRVLLAGLPPNALAGTVEQLRESLGELEEAGVERVMLQHLTHRDLEGVALISELAG